MKATSKDTSWIRKLEEEGQIKLNKPIEAAPKVELFTDLFWVWEAFCRLSDMRNVGMNGPLPITPEQILSYCVLKGIRSSEDRGELLNFLSELDPIWLKEHYDKAEKRREREKAKPPSKK